MTRNWHEDRRSLIGLGAGTALGISSGSQFAGLSPPIGADGSERLDVNVRDFGAVGDGVTDDTAAFNRATDASATWSKALERRIVIPPGRYRLTGTVHIRKGQDFVGAGYATQIDAQRVSGSTFVLGQAAGATAPDPGGSPISFCGFRALGSAPRAPFILVKTEGFSIRDLFLTALGTALWIEGADGVIQNVIIDQALNGIVFGNAQNILVSGFYTYLANYAVTVNSECRDIAIANSAFAYCRNAAILLAEGARHIRGLSFTGCNFVQNEQFETFSGFVQCRASEVDALFVGCQFRNWPAFAIEQGAGRNIAITFNGCIFDAVATNHAYNQSLTARVLTTGVAGRFHFNDCEFRNLFGPVARVRPGGAEVTIGGGGAYDCRPPLLTVEDPGARIQVRHFDGVALGSQQRRLIPSWVGATWRLTARLADSEGKRFVEEVIVTDNGDAPPTVQRVVGPVRGALRLTIAPGADRTITVDVAAETGRLTALAATTVA